MVITDSEMKFPISSSDLHFIPYRRKCLIATLKYAAVTNNNPMGSVTKVFFLFTKCILNINVKYPKCKNYVLLQDKTILFLKILIPITGILFYNRCRISGLEFIHTRPFKIT